MATCASLLRSSFIWSALDAASGASEDISTTRVETRDLVISPAIMPPTKKMGSEATAPTIGQIGRLAVLRLAPGAGRLDGMERLTGASSIGPNPIVVADARAHGGPREGRSILSHPLPVRRPWSQGAAEPRRRVIR
ncbi:hypothetical protein D3C86_1417720 [compost metagenome]